MCIFLYWLANLPVGFLPACVVLPDLMGFICHMFCHCFFIFAFTNLLCLGSFRSNNYNKLFNVILINDKCELPYVTFIMVYLCTGKIYQYFELVISLRGIQCCFELITIFCCCSFCFVLFLLFVVVVVVTHPNVLQNCCL